MIFPHHTLVSPVTMIKLLWLIPCFFSYHFPHTINGLNLWGEWTVLSLVFGHEREQFIHRCWIHDLGSPQKHSLITSAPGNRLFTSGRQALCKCFFFPHFFRRTQNYPQLGKSTFYYLLGVVTMSHLSDGGMSYPFGGDHLKGLLQKGFHLVSLSFCI